MTKNPAALALAGAQGCAKFGCVGVQPFQGAAADKSRPQYRQTLASALMRSAQYSQFLNRE